MSLKPKKNKTNKRILKKGIAAHHPHYFSQKMDGKEFVSIKDVDIFDTREEAMAYAKRWKGQKYLTKVTKEKDGKYRFWVHKRM